MSPSSPCLTVALLLLPDWVTIDLAPSTATVLVDRRRVEVAALGHVGLRLVAALRHRRRGVGAGLGDRRIIVLREGRGRRKQRER